MSRNKWEREPAPPPPLFLGERERNLTKQINDELLERVIGKQILYYPIDFNSTNYHPQYKEAIVKNFLPPVHVYAMVRYDGQQQEQTGRGVDRKSTLTIFFHERRQQEDQDLFVRVGDFVKYGSNFYEIVETTEDRELFGQVDFLFEIMAVCKKARKGAFDGT